MKKKRIKWIDGLKLFACCFVFFSHFQGFFYSSCNVDLGYSKVLKLFLDSPVNFLKNGNYWMCVFCIISGFFACKKKVESAKNLVYSLFSRYIRFVIPLFLANIMAYIISGTIGFYTQKYGEIFQNDWIKQYYDFKITFWIVIRATLKMTSELDSPLWMLKPLFLGTCVIYVLKYLLSKMNAFLVNGLVIVGYSCIFCFFPQIHENYLYAWITCLGCFLHVILDKEYVKINNKAIITGGFFACFLSPWLINGVLVSEIQKHVMVAPYVVNYLNAIMGLCLLIFVENSGGIKKFLESETLMKLNGLSFGIYLFHWLLISSFSLVIYEALIYYFNINIVFLIDFALTLGVVGALAFAFHSIIENNIGKCQNRIKEYIVTIVKR
jgi:peptidoglycan/LPS O-acetylase OafA/YrhL